MSSSLTSPAPTPPSGSSNPVSLKSWWKVITDWLDSLSPAGVAAHDTNWQTVTLAAGYTGTVQARRIGRKVSWRGAITRTAGAFPTGANHIVVDPGGVPAGLYSTSSFAHNVGAGINVVGLPCYLMVGTNGSLTLRVSTAGNEFHTNLLRYTLD